MNDFIIYGSNKEGTHKYLLSLLQDNFDPSFHKKINETKTVIILPGTLDSLTEKYGEDEQALTEELNRINSDMTTADIIITLDNNINRYTCLSMIYEQMYIVPVCADKKQNKSELRVLKKSNTGYSTTSPIIQNAFELNDTVLVGQYSDLVELKKSKHDIIFNNKFRFDINDNIIIDSNIKQPVEVVGAVLKINKKTIFTANFRKMDYKNFISIFTLIKKSL